MASLPVESSHLWKKVFCFFKWKRTHNAKCASSQQKPATPRTNTPFSPVPKLSTTRIACPEPGGGFRAEGFGFMVYGFWFLVHSLWFMMYGLFLMEY